jgi:hypothetical protein
MEALFASLVSKYGFEVAAKMLGLDQQKDNPKFTFGMPFTGQQINFDPLKSLGRFGLNKVMSGGMSGMSGIMGPAALLGGAVMLGRAFDPMRPGSRNYSPNLRGQVDYLSGISGMIGRDSNSGLMKYGPESVLRGQNVSSMFGTNNYQDQLQNKIDYFEDRIKKGKSINEDKYEQAKKEKDDFFEYRADIREKARQPKTTYTPPPSPHSGNGGNGGGFDTSKSGGEGAFGSYDGSRGRKDYSRGGIASL